MLVVGSLHSLSVTGLQKSVLELKPRITLREQGMGTPTVCVLAPKFRPQ
jgi:hypothetical protein